MGQDYTDYLEALKKCVLFDGIDENEINKILHCLQYRIVQYKKNDYAALMDQLLEGVGIVLRVKRLSSKKTLTVTGP